MTYKMISNTIKKSIGIFYQKKNSIKHLTFSFEQKYENYLKNKQFAGSRSVKYLGGKLVRNFKAPYIFRTESKKKILKSSAEYILGKELTSLINMKSIKKMVALFVGGGLGDF